MIKLSSTTDTIQVVLAAPHTTTAPKCFSSYSDITTTTFVPGRKGIDTNGITAVNVVDSPAASTQREIDTLSILNVDTANCLVTVNFSDNGTLYPLFSCVLGVGEKLEYDKGWRVFANSGAIKNSLNQGNSATSSSLLTAVLGTDVTNNNAIANTLQDVTGLSFPVIAGNKYFFRYIIQYTAAATTTGSRWSLNGPTTSALRYRSSYSLTTTTETVNGGIGIYDSPATSNTTSATTASNVCIIEGFIEPTSDGNVIARFASEISASAIVAKAGSIVYYQQVI